MGKNRKAGRTAGKEGRGDWNNGRKADAGGKRGKFFFPLVILLAAMAVIFAACMVASGGRKGTGPGTWGGSVRAETGAGETGENGDNPLSGRNIYFSGMEDAVIGMDGIVCLENSVENGDFLMKYEVYEAEGGEPVYESGLIASGGSVDWMPGGSLGAGEHLLTFLQVPCYMDGEGNCISLTRGSCQAWLRIKGN